MPSLRAVLSGVHHRALLRHTALYRFDGNLESLGFLHYDVTNLAYAIPNLKTGAVIGVGGGRDVLSQRLFGVVDVTGIEINPIIIDVLEHHFSDYTAIAVLDGVKFEVDEARSWFARTPRSFDVIQMSLIDTWAATGAGAFTLTENGLYTVEAWRRFRSAQCGRPVHGEPLVCAWRSE